jgi:hypothetical protein
MDAGHDEEDPVLHRHVIRLDWVHTEFEIAYGFAPGWHVSLAVPYDVKAEHAHYELPDGSPFFDPEGDLHHRTETLNGFGDLKLVVTRRFESVFVEGDALSIGAGFTIPSGKTEPDPFKLGDAGIRHEHIQFGTGTFDPLAQLSYGYVPGTFGFHVSAALRAPLYENGHGYQGSTAIEYSIGPCVALADWISFSVHYAGIYLTHAYWSHRFDPDSGFFLQGVSFALPIKAGAWTIRPNALYVLDVQTSGEETFRLDWMFGLAIERTIGE